MEGIVQKLRYKAQERVAVINAPAKYLKLISRAMQCAKTDTSIDQRYLYDFMVVFVNSSTDVKTFTPDVLHNLATDGMLWFVYPKKSGKKEVSDINRDNGWEPLSEHGFRPVSQVSVSDSLSALRFRNEKYIKKRQTVDGDR